MCVLVYNLLLACGFTTSVFGSLSAGAHGKSENSRPVFYDEFHFSTELAQAGQEHQEQTVDTAWIAAVAAFSTEFAYIDKSRKNTAHRKDPQQWPLGYMHCQIFECFVMFC